MNATRFAGLMLAIIALSCTFSLDARAANLILNPSFEDNQAAFTQFPGYSNQPGNTTIANWTGSPLANTGINGTGGSGNPFADNGAVPNGVAVAFAQAAAPASILSQSVGGLTTGSVYQISARINARNGGVPNAAISFGGEELYTNQGILPVGGANPYGYAVFYRNATAASETLAFQNNTGVDTTLLVDDVHVEQLDYRHRILFQDNFNNTTGAQTDLNSDIARTTGVYAGTTYTMAFGPGHYGHQLQNGAAINQLLVADFANSTSSVNENFNLADSQGGLRITLDIDSMPAVYGGGDGEWGAINLGAAAADQLVNVNGGAAHFGILFRRSGVIQAFDGAAIVSNNEVYTGTNPNGAIMRHVELLLTDRGDGNPFDGVGETLIQVFGDVNGFSAPIFTYAKGGGGYADNFINLQGSFRAHMDNLTIMQIPEPGSIGLLSMGLIGLAGLSRRKRVTR